MEFDTQVPKNLQLGRERCAPAAGRKARVIGSSSYATECQSHGIAVRVQYCNCHSSSSRLLVP